MAKQEITIIGLGKVGTAWLNILPENGYSVTSVFSRSEADDSLKKSHLNTRFLKGLPQSRDEVGNIIFITVSDDAIESVAEKIALNIADLSGKYILHCSGVLSSKALDVLKQKGAKTASFHPLKAITKNNKTFSGSWFDIEGDKEVLQEVEKLCTKLNAHSFRIKAEAKSHLHASAVVASNYLVVLADMVKKISAQGGISEETVLKALTPLMQNTLSNIEELGTEEALTGPIARGDVQTIRNHLDSLKNDSELVSLYKLLGISAVDIARKKSGNSEALIKIKNILT